MPPLTNLISHVVGVCADREMVRIDAIRNVARAQNAQTCRNVSEVNLVRCAMRQKALAEAVIDLPVASVIKASQKKPAAAFRYRHGLREKAIFKRCYFALVNSAWHQIPQYSKA